jgi:hypothetical protein
MDYSGLQNLYNVLGGTDLAVGGKSGSLFGNKK